MLPALLAIQRFGCQSTYTRFFQGFTSAGKNLATFRPESRSWFGHKWVERKAQCQPRRRPR